MAAALSALYKGVNCPQQIATAPAATYDPYPVWQMMFCPLCDKEHSFVFDSKRFVSTPSQYTKYKSYCALHNILFLGSQPET